MKKTPITSTFFSFCTVLGFGQGETSNWYLGHSAGIRFNPGGSVTPLDHGMYESNPLPTSDYWFRVKLSDGRKITGHFALKR